MYYKFVFADGYICICKALSSHERYFKELKHGKLIEKTACN